MFTIYIIKSLITGSYYRGFIELTAEERLVYHNKGVVPATKDKGPWKIVWYAVFESREKALVFERYLKSGSGHAFTWKRLINRE